MSSLDRIIKLAKKTGDRVIVHNPVDGTDMVIMNVDEYEMLLENNDSADFNPARDVRRLSERELLNQINRDISIWRASEKLEQEYEDDEVLHSEEDTSSWHSAGSVLGSSDFEEYAPGLETEPETDLESPSLVPVEAEDVSNSATSHEESNQNGLVSDDEPVFYEEPV